MDFKNTSTRSGLIEDCEDLCGLGATGISGNTSLLQQFTRWINQWNQKVTTIILESQDDSDFDDTNHADYPSGTITGTTNQDYAFPTSMKLLHLKRVDVTYDGTNYNRATPFDSGAVSDPLADINSFTSTSAPRYDYKYGALWLYPKFTAAQVSAGAKIRLEFFREPSAFATSDTTKEPGFDEPFHKILSLGASFEYAQTYQRANKADLWAQLQDYEARLRKYYGRKNQDSQLALGSVYDSNYGS